MGTFKNCTKVTCLLFLIFASGCSETQLNHQHTKPLDAKILEMGIYAVKDEDYTSAIKYLLNAIEENPANALAHAWLGVAYARMGRLADAQYELQKAQETGKTEAAKITAGEIFLLMNDPQQAMVEFSSALANNPSPELYEAIARTAAKLKDKTRAIDAYRKAIGLENHHAIRKRWQIAAANFCLLNNETETAINFLDNKVFIGAEYFSVKEGIEIAKTMDGWPAAKAGIKAGDIITKLNGQNLAGISHKDFSALLDNLKPCSIITVQLIRNNKTIDLELPTGFNSPPQQVLIDKPQNPHPDARKAKKIILKGVPNFYQVSETLYRSAQPDKNAFIDLAKMGIRTVINLRSFHGEGDLVQNAGMRYLHLYVKGWHPENKEIISFLKIVTNTNYTPVLVHCQHGADRTGVMVAIYRIVIQNWTVDDAIREMTEGGFGFHPLWQNLISYVKELDIDEIKEKIQEK